jgi:hypothetical protein
LSTISFISVCFHPTVFGCLVRIEYTKPSLLIIIWSQKDLDWKSRSLNNNIREVA